MAYLRQVLHLIHLTCFSFILGNMINEYFFGKTKYEKDQYPLLGKLYSYAWLGMIVTGIWQIMVISLQHKYVKNKKYKTWVQLLFFKTIFGLFSAYGIELFVKLFIPEANKKSVLKYMRIFCFLFLFVFSGMVREFRETQLKKKEDVEAKKKEAEENKKKSMMIYCIIYY